MACLGGADDSDVEVLIEEFTEHLDLSLRQGVHSAKGWLSIIFQIDFEVIEMMFGKGVCPILAEYISVLVVFLRDARHIRLSRSGRA